MRRKEWSPEEGHRERDEKSWKLSVMSCTKQESCASCNSFQRRLIKQREKEAKEKEDHELRTHQPQDQATRRETQTSKGIPDPSNEHRDQKEQNCPDHQQLST